MRTTIEAMTTRPKRRRREGKMDSMFAFDCSAGEDVQTYVGYSNLLQKVEGRNVRG